MPARPGLWPVIGMITIVANALAVWLVAAQPAPPPEPREGRWRLTNVNAESDGGPVHSSVWTYRTVGSELRVDIHSISPTGRPLHWFYQTKLDGSDARVTGNPSVDFVAVNRVDARTGRISYKKGGVVTTVGTNVISDDGKTMTITLKHGESSAVIGAYERMR